MGTCCSSDNIREGQQPGNFERIESAGNLDNSKFAAMHGPKASIATKTNQTDIIKEVHEEMTQLKITHRFDEYKDLGDNLGPYAYTFENSIYYGQYQNGLRHGLGILINYKDGFSYEGVFEKDKITGKGAMITSERDYLIGMFEDGEPHGEVILTREDGYYYQGEWKQSEKDGQGQEILPDKSEYKGQFQNNEREGKGTMKWDDSVYNGNWVQGRMNGFGTMQYDDGRKYVGMFERDTFSGKGEFTWPDGRKYDGEWQDGAKHGHGKYTDRNNMVFEGEFEKGKQHGQGQVSNTEGKMMQSGTWVSGIKVSSQ